MGVKEVTASMKSSKSNSSLTVVAYFDNWESVLAIQRVAGPAEHAGIRLIRGNAGEEISSEPISLADLVVIQRDFPRHSSAYEEIIARAHNEGKPVVYEIDDLLLELPKDHPDKLDHYYTNALFPMVQAIVEADAVTASTPQLCTYLRSFNPNTWLLPNYLNDRVWAFRNPPEDAGHFPVVVGYMGTYTHLPDLEWVALPLKSILHRYGDKVVFRLWGGKPPADLSDYPNVEWTPLRLENYTEFATYFSKQECDLVIAPLRDNLFNRCKSPLKFLEYGALCLPGVFSRVVPYESIVDHGKNGFLASTLDEWEEYLVELIESSSLRHQVGIEAQRTVRKNWLLSQHAQEWKRVYQKILSAKGNQPEDNAATRVVRQMRRLHSESQLPLAEKVAALSSQAAEKEQALQALMGQLTEKERAVQTLHAQVVEKEQTVQVLETQVAEKEQAVQVLEMQLAEKEQAIQLLGAQLRERQDRWSDLERGVGWRALQKLRALRLRLVPYNSRRERWFYLILRKKEEKKREGLSATTDAVQESEPTVPMAVSVQASDSIPLYRRKPQGNLEADVGMRIQKWLGRFPKHLPVVVVPVFNAYDDVVRCAQSLLGATEKNVPIIILDDASTDDRLRSMERLCPHRLVYLRKSSNTGFVNTVNLAFRWCAPRDVVIVNSDVVVPSEWLPRLGAAAYSRSNAATATPFTNNGTILSIPYRNRPTSDLPGTMSPEEVDARIRTASKKLRPIIPTAVGHCMYFRRLALDAVGYFDETFSPGYGEEVDFSQRAVTAGFIHVLADDLFVFHRGSQSFQAANPARRSLQESHEQIIDARYPWYRHRVVDASTDPQSPLANAIERASTALLGHRVAIDATLVDGTITGTQVLTLELIRALASAPAHAGHLTVILQDTVPTEVLLGVDRLVDDVVRVSELRNLKQPAFDLIHRPFQIRTAADLELLQRAAARSVVSQLDCIAFSNPSYAPSPEAWVDYRHLTQKTFASADGIAFISNDVASDAARQELYIPEERKCVTYVGVDHQLHSPAVRPPSSSDKFSHEPFIVMLGTNFKHKNRVFAIQELKVLIDKYSWSGSLVFAGPNVSWGGSEAEEEFELEHNPGLKSRVHYLGPVSESEKKWLLENAALVLYPSSYEGFGLVPFEAAAAGTPALTTRLTSLIEILGEGVTYLDTLDPERGAETIFLLLSNPEFARRQVEAINARASIFTWGSIATKVWGFYKQILEMPPRSRERSSELEDAEDEGPQAIEELWNSNGKKLGVPWRRLLARAFHILRTEGFPILILKAWRYFLS